MRRRLRWRESTHTGTGFDNYFPMSLFRGAPRCERMAMILGTSERRSLWRRGYDRLDGRLYINLLGTGNGR